MGGGGATTAGGEINRTPTNDGTKYTPFCCQERKEEQLKAPKTIPGGKGGCPVILFLKEARS